MSKESSLRKENRKRVQTWRKKISEEGGKLIQVHLKKKDIGLLESLRKIPTYKNLGELIGAALIALQDRLDCQESEHVACEKLKNNAKWHY